MATANVLNFGALGRTVTTTGSIDPGSNILKVASVTGFKIDCGVGVFGADRDAVIPLLTTLRTKILAIDPVKNTLTLEASAPSTIRPLINTQVVSDDSIPIQAAIDFVSNQGGGVVDLPAGTYPIGAPRGTSNTPLFVPGNVTLRGAGRDLTILRLCNDAMQVPRAYNSLDVPSSTRGYGLPCAVLLVNSANVWWHRNKPWTPPSALNDPLVKRDKNIAVEGMTLDGNNYNQRYVFSAENRTNGALADVRASPFVEAITLSPPPLRPSVPPPKQVLPITPGKKYYVYVTWGDAAGNETGGGRNQQCTVEAGRNALLITMPDGPQHAQSQFVYLADKDNDPIDLTSWPYPIPPRHDSGEAFVVSWEKIQLPSVMRGGEQIRIAWHVIDPSVTTPNFVNPPQTFYPPGVGLIGFGPATSPATYWDNCENVLLSQLKIINTVNAGIGLSSPAVNISSLPDHTPRDIRVEDVDVINAGGFGLTCTAGTERVVYERVNCINCLGGAVDYEPNATVATPVYNILFHNCRMAGSWSAAAAIAIVAYQNSPAKGLVIDGCEFDDNRVHISLNDHFIDAAITNCRFTNAGSAAVRSNAQGFGVLSNCYFELNGRNHPVPPNNFTDELMAGHFQCTVKLPTLGIPHWIVADNLFVSEADPASVSIDLGSGVSGILYNNEFRIVQRSQSPPVADLNPNADLARIAVREPTAFLVANNRGFFQLV